MELFKKFEKKVLNLLASNVLSSDQINDVIYNGELVSYEYTGSGYYLDIRHSNLPKERIVCDKPIVIGEADGIICGFIVFIEDTQLTIECHTWGEINVFEEFRGKDVQVKATVLEKGEFVDLKSLF